MNGDSSMTISIVTRCMDRRSFLEHSLPTWLPLPIREIIIVDWGMLEPLDDLCDLDPRITILHVPNQNYFDAGRAINTGVNYADSDIIFHIDSDIKVKTSLVNVFNHLPIIHHNADAIIVDITVTDYLELCGTCMFTKNAWKSVGGYFEGLPSWGGEDLYFFKCLREHYRVFEFFSECTLSHIYHGDALRYEHMRRKNNIRDDTPARLMIDKTTWPQPHSTPEYTVYGMGTKRIKIQG
jgi:predicted glycosyltransferase involved in capsule biosynthesis